ncbi:hypothetical protein PULV_a3362 [Pseudoalteromonas ulvae UL12]|uniref:GGDEF domain-containing protein n=1 Tax=Pseudoalteromonas ulvae TaxID=107327 RepID=A0A244CPS0_PSEDV|nr:GGDEF domain-containing phosphodiesterase [Pseudoalteromonas ulvae]MBE0365053.1 hypothetical protein [Pseudoalteromonas ulvae UL12]OUL57610.1 hypothetical protein B1199_11110 [Pseudoalteromonas ulvae]
MSLLKWFTITALGLCSLGLSASEQLNVFNPTSFVAGMLLISWLLCTQLNQGVITRVLNIAAGVTSLAFLSFHKIELIALPIFAIIAELIFQLKDNRRYSQSAVAGYIALGCMLLVAIGVVGFSLSIDYLALGPIAFFLSQCLLIDLSIKQDVTTSTDTHLPEPVIQHDVVPDRAILKQCLMAQSRLTSCQLVLFKFDGFSDINHKLGHEFGDLLLVQLVARIKAVLSDEALLVLSQTQDFRFARLNSVEFAFIVKDLSQQYRYQQLINELARISSQPVIIKGCTLNTELKAAMVPIAQTQEPIDAEQTLKHAYLALEMAVKQQATFVDYHAELSDAREAQLEKIMRLSNADFNQEFELYFHPVIDLKTNKVLFIELLLRWQHPEKGLLDAAAFVNEIRMAGLSYEVTRWVLEKAAEISLMLKVENIQVPVSVNLFGPELFQDEMVEYLAELIAVHHLNPKYLIIECPAGVLLDLEDKGAAILKRLKNVGTPVCLDDLGVSPLLLTQLPKLTLHYVKLDDVLIAEFSQNTNSRNLLRGIISMCNNLDTKVIAEGVASNVLLEFVETLECDGAQGYLFARPLSVVGITAWLNQWQHKLDAEQLPY